MRVFRIQNDVNRYQFFLGRTDADYEILQMDGTPKLESWKAPEVIVYKPKHQRGDFLIVRIQLHVAGEYRAAQTYYTRIAQFVAQVGV